MLNVRQKDLNRRRKGQTINVSKFGSASFIFKKL